MIVMNISLKRITRKFPSSIKHEPVNMVVYLYSSDANHVLIEFKLTKNNHEHWITSMPGKRCYLWRCSQNYKIILGLDI